MRRNAFPFAVIFSLLLAATGATVSTGATETESGARIAWRACATPELPTKECGELAVPLDYDEPDGATISVIVARVPATDQAKRIGSLSLECRGTGRPTVVLEAGYRPPATVWNDDLLRPDSPREMVLPEIAKQTRVCAYERPGVAALLEGGLHPSRGDSVPMPRTAESVVTDLHALLTAAGESGPYVLVGIVLVDAWSEGLEMLLTPDQWAAYVVLNAVIPLELAGYPDLETLDFAAASATMRRAAAATPLDQMPLVVVSKGQPFGVPAEALEFDPVVLESAWAAAQDGLAGLLPDARHVTAAESSHYAQLEQPELVVAAIGQVVGAVRSPSTWTTSATGRWSGRYGCYEVSDRHRSCPLAGSQVVTETNGRG